MHWQQNGPPGTSNYNSRQLPLPGTLSPTHVNPPPLRNAYSDGAPPLPARPHDPISPVGHEPLSRPLSSQGLTHYTSGVGANGMFAAPPPPPPLPPRLHSSTSATNLHNVGMHMGQHGHHASTSHAQGHLAPYPQTGMARPISMFGLNVPPPPNLPSTSTPIWAQGGAAQDISRAQQEKEELRRRFEEADRQRDEEDRARRHAEEERARRHAEEERRRQEEEERRAEATRRELERLRIEEESRQAAERERQHQEELQRQREEELARQKQLEELAHQKMLEEQARKDREEQERILKEEEEKRLLEQRLREQWEEEDRIRRARWAEEDKLRREAERLQWMADEQERVEKLRREMEDEKFATLEALREEMEAERVKKVAEERAKASEEVARAEAERLRALEERDKKARMLQEEKDAEVARRLQESEEDASEAARLRAIADASPSGEHVHHGDTPRPSNDLPYYEPPPQFAPPDAPPEPSHQHNQSTAYRPHANTVHSISPPPMHIPPPAHPPGPSNMHHSGPPPGPQLNMSHLPGPQYGMPPSPNRHSMISPEERRGSPNHAFSPMHQHVHPANHPGYSGHPNHAPMDPNHSPFPPNRPFPNAGTGGPPYRNSFFPHHEAETHAPAPAPAPPADPPHHRPNKLQRPSASLGGSNPGRPGANARPHQASVPPPVAPARMGGGGGSGTGHITSPTPPPGHAHSSASVSLPSSSSPSTSGRPSTASGRFATSETESPGAGSSSQPIPSSSSTDGSMASPPAPYRLPAEALGGIVHGFGRPVIRHQDLPAATPIPDVIQMEPEPSPPFHIVSHTWKHLLKYIASQNTTRVEPSPAALAREKGGPPNLRVVMHFVKLPVPTAEWRIVLYLAVQSITPPPDNYPVNDTSVVPYLFPSPEPGRPLANNPDTQIYTIPTLPLPVLPLSLPNLAPYLQAALEESQRSNDSKARLAKLVNTTIQAANAMHSSVPTVLVPMMAALSGGNKEQDIPGAPVRINESSGASKGNVFSRLFRQKGSGAKGKGLNNEMYDVVTPYNIEYQ